MTRILALTFIALFFVSAAAASKTPSVSLRKIDHTLTQIIDWQLRHMVKSPELQSEQETGWVQATFYLGLARFAEATKNPRYIEVLRQLGHRNGWRLGERLYHADDYLIGQVYVATFDHYGDPLMLEPMKQRFEQVLATPSDVGLTFDETHRCQQRWCWCDAFFMAPASWMALSRITGDRRYRDFADSEFRASQDFLFDRDTHLFYRDSRFFGQRGPDNEKIFWSRGNGWVFAGLINILRELPRGDPGRQRYETLFLEMANALIKLQRADGFWPASLLAAPRSSVAESSGTALFIYGLASGIKLELLDRRQYTNAVLRGWAALAGAVNTQGRVGHVQQIADRPGAVDAADSQFYGSGALLLAGVAVREMIISR